MNRIIGRVRMVEIIKAFGTGVVCGVVFSSLKLPIPAPPVVAGLAGILGIFLGYRLWDFIRRW